MFFMIVGVLIILNIGAFIRMRHESNLKKRNHLERRNGVRVMPNTKWAAKKRKDSGEG
jgi:hypothetical protein